MKLIKIRIGKAWNVLRRDGLWRGGKRVLEALSNLFRRVRPGDVLFITNGVGDSARYRTNHVAEELAHCGFQTAITVQDNPFILSYADKFSIFVFHRVLFSGNVAVLIERLKKAGKEIIFDTDDLVYAPEFLRHMDYYRQMNLFEKQLYVNGLGGEIVSDVYVKVCTTTTKFLADKLREKGKQVFVVRNKISKADVQNAEEILSGQITSKKRQITEGAQKVRVVYLSGTPSHNKDFATISPVLAFLMQKYPQMCLVLAGPLDIDDRLATFTNRIERVPFLSRKKYFENIARMDINLAPLEIGNPFCESKSELKWFEAGLVAVPTVAAATENFSAAITDGVDGYVAKTEVEWKEKIEKLIIDHNLRTQIGAKARETVLQKYSTQSSFNTEYCEYLRSKIL